MTDISEIFSAPTQSTVTYADSVASGDMMGKEDFLTLLVAQLQNQDPLNPDDPTEFTAQLAQFSSLEQLYNLNDSMEALTSSQESSDAIATTDLIGKTISYADENFTIEDDGYATIGYELDGTAESVTLTINDDTGTTVATIYGTALEEGEHFLEWDGIDDNGEHVTAGSYTISLDATTADGEDSVAISPLVQSEVTGVNYNNGVDGAIIYTTAGAEINSASVLAVYSTTSNINLPTNTDESTSEDDTAGISENDQESEDSLTETAASTVDDTALSDDEQIELEQLEFYLTDTN